MNFKGLVTVFVMLFLLGPAAPQSDDSTNWKPGELGEGLSWMNIPSTEHTSEYLSKSGGSVGSAGAYTSQDVRGNWTLELRTLDDKPFGTIDMQLYQIGSVVFGTGVVPTSGQQVTGNGGLVENTLNLNVVAVTNANLYQMRMDLSGNGASGNFNGFAPDGSTSSGRVIAEKDVPRTLS